MLRGYGKSTRIRRAENMPNLRVEAMTVIRTLLWSCRWRMIWLSSIEEKTPKGYSRYIEMNRSFPVSFWLAWNSIALVIWEDRQVWFCLSGILVQYESEQSLQWHVWPFLTTISTSHKQVLFHLFSNCSFDQDRFRSFIMVQAPLGHLYNCAQRITTVYQSYASIPCLEPLGGMLLSNCRRRHKLNASGDTRLHISRTLGLCSPFS